MSLEALALEYMNDRHTDNDCGCRGYIEFVQVWMAKPYHLPESGQYQDDFEEGM